MPGPRSRCEIHESNVAVLRGILGRLDRNVTSVVLHLRNDGFLAFARPEDIPPHVRKLEVRYDCEAAPEPLLRDAYGVPLVAREASTSSALNGGGRVPTEAVERFAALLRDVDFSFHTTIPWATSVTYTSKDGWNSKYDP